MYDVLIVGGGPAGLSAALVLGRCRRRVLVCDADRPRNAVSRALHGFLTRDGTSPADLRRVGREQLRPYPDVEVRQVEVASVDHADRGFSATLRSGETVSARKLLLATGVVDDLPAVDGMQRYYGRGVFHCPYCDGWEVRDRRLAVYGRGRHGPGMARTLIGWSRDLVVCTDGPADLNAEDDAFLKKHRLRVREERVIRLEGDDEGLQRVVFASGDPEPCRALFFSTGQYLRCELARALGCEVTEKGSVEVNRLEMTNVPGVYVAGDVTRDVQLAVVAAAEGATAAFAINKALLAEDFL